MPPNNCALGMFKSMKVLRKRKHAVTAPMGTKDIFLATRASANREAPIAALRRQIGEDQTRERTSLCTKWLRMSNSWAHLGRKGGGRGDQITSLGRNCPRKAQSRRRSGTAPWEGKSDPAALHNSATFRRPLEIGRWAQALVGGNTNAILHRSMQTEPALDQTPGTQM